ncbi:MAG: HAMP domain-containing sensor histidine kinase [Cyclobacteriaceae bacterium]
MSRTFANLVKAIIFKREDHNLSYTQHKRILLTGQLCLISFTVVILYALFDLAFGIDYTWPYQLSCAAVIGLGLYLNRMGRHTVASLLLGIGINLTVFIFSSLEQVSTGLYMFYMTTAVGAYAVFGYEGRKKAMFIAGLSIACFLLMVFFPFDILPQHAYSESYIAANLIFNFLISLIACVTIIHFMLAIHQRSEGILMENEKKLVAQNQELIKINSELDKFVYSTSHDLRAPLSSVRGLIQLLEREKNMDEIMLYLGLMKNRVENLDKFITDISDYSRNSRTEVTEAPVHVKECIGNVIDSLRFYPGSDRVQMHVNVPDDLSIVSDPMRLQLVIGNLVSNAFKYYDSGKAEHYLNISARVKDASLDLMFADNGIGIVPERLSRVFDMFFQAHERSVGSGLGLYIVKETMEKLGGSVRAQSTEGMGSTFIVSLPLRPEQHVSGDAESPKMP